MRPPVPRHGRRVGRMARQSQVLAVGEKMRAAALTQRAGGRNAALAREKTERWAHVAAASTANDDSASAQHCAAPTLWRWRSRTVLMLALARLDNARAGAACKALGVRLSRLLPRRHRARGPREDGIAPSSPPSSTSRGIRSCSWSWARARMAAEGLAGGSGACASRRVGPWGVPSRAGHTPSRERGRAAVLPWARTGPAAVSASQRARRCGSPAWADGTGGWGKRVRCRVAAAGEAATGKRTAGRSGRGAPHAAPRLSEGVERERALRSTVVLVPSALKASHVVRTPRPVLKVAARDSASY